MIKELKMLEEVNAVRRVVTKPLKTPPEALAAFTQYMKDKHNIADMESPEGQEYLKVYRTWPAMNHILQYMGWDE